MRLKTLAMMLFSAATLLAQTADPVIMVVGGQPVLRSEFEYSYNKNNSEGVIDQKTVEEYVPLYVNYKLKVLAALEAGYDTLTSFREEFAMYRDQQVLPLLVTDEDVENEAREIYQRTKDRIGPDGLVQVSHILILVPQQASAAEQAAARARIDSVAQALKQGAVFEELARQVSQDPGSASNGGLLPFVEHGQLVKEFEDVAFVLQPSEVSDVVETPYGYHIIKGVAHKEFEPYEFHRESIMRFIEQNSLRDRIANGIADSLAASAGTTTAELLTAKAEELSAQDSDLRYLIQEYYEGLLIYEISNRLVFERAANDEAGLARFFKKNKKRYAWSQPRYKGMVYHVTEPSQVKAVKDCVRHLPFDQWAEALRTTFNGDSIIRIRVEKGLFRPGQSAFVDSLVFHTDTTCIHPEGYPIDGVYGRLLKKGPEDYTDVRGLVVADYQEYLERQWVEELRRRFSVEIDEEVVRTVNNHE